MTENQQIAQTILEQLGGRKFVFMCGVKMLTAIERGLSFRIPGTLTRNRINYVKITLDPDDVYTVEFCVIRKLTSRRVSLWEGVYCDNLCDLFREQTGLETRLPTFATA
jgi:hypothetical protein